MVRVVIIVAIIIVVGVPTVAATLWALRQQAAGSARVIAMPDTAPERAFLGGSLSGSWSASWPLARLEFLDWGIRLGGSVRPVRWVIGTWEARYEELATVRLISSLTPGVRLAVKGSTDAVVFWTFQDSREIADRLEAHGVPVDRSAMSLRKAGGIYRSW
jgi:hypothetical protein